MTDIVFNRTLNSDPPFDLVFGESLDPGDQIVSIQSRLSLKSNMQFGDSAEISFSIPIRSLTSTVALNYDVNNTHGPQLFAGIRYEEATPQKTYVEDGWQLATKLAMEDQLVWALGKPLSLFESIAWDEAVSLDNESAAAWDEATPLHPADAVTSWQEAASIEIERAFAWNEARKTSINPLVSVWQQMDRRSRPTYVVPWGEGSPVRKEWRTRYQEGHTIENDIQIPWQEAMHPKPGRSVILPPQPPVDPDLCYIPPLGNAVILPFKDLLDLTRPTDLVFICMTHGEPLPPQVIVPIKKVYIVINTVVLTRVEGAIEIKCPSFSMSLDVDSWTWGFNANLPASELSKVMPNSNGEPVELEANINGTKYRLICESVQRSRSFREQSISIRGRGKAALLDAPYAPTLNFANSDDRTANQLMLDALTTNGVSIGWDVDFGLDDWTVPANVWSMQGTYINALNAIANAAGGYLQPHRTLDVIRVLKRYPVAPWNWLTDVTPDFLLPSAVTLQEGISWVDKPLYNRIFVSGQSRGVLGQVTRLGTDGGIERQMITEQLITQDIAARQRGIAELSDSGRQATVSLRLPVLSETGVIEPGKFVQYVDGPENRLGLVRGVQIDAGIPEVWQTLTLETHE